MKSFTVLCMVVAWIVLLSGGLTAQGLSVEELVLCKNIENRQPVDAGTAFPDTIKKVYCYTKIIGAQDTTAVSHVWFFNDKEMARVELPVKNKVWRTWSSKAMIKDWAGNWRVDIIDTAGTVLKSQAFTIEKSQ